jgi:N-acetyl-beta-hexosaminidase
LKKRGTSSNVADFPKEAKQQAPIGATKAPDSAPINQGQIAVMLTLMSESDSKAAQAREAQARVHEYASQIIQMSGMTPALEFRVNWDNKTVERIPRVPPKPEGPPLRTVTEGTT